MKLQCLGSLGRRLIAVAVTVMTFILAAVPQANAQDGRALAPLLVKAKQEGALTIFTGTARYPDSAVKQLEQDFRHKYGFALRITLAAPGPHPPGVQKTIAKPTTAGQTTLDMIS